MLALACSAQAQVPLPTPISIQGTPSKPDALGRYTVKLEIPDQPVTVGKGTTWEGAYVYRLPGNVTIRRVRTFLGVDRGNVWEGHLLVLAEDFLLHAVGPHKERSVGEYDAWASADTDYRVPPEGADLWVFGLSRPTLPGKAIKSEMGVVLELMP